MVISTQFKYDTKAVMFGHVEPVLELDIIVIRDDITVVKVVVKS